MIVVILVEVLKNDIRINCFKVIYFKKNMLKDQVKSNRFWMLLPLFGTILFFILYIIGAFLYPGGSQIDKHSEGFSWMNNYWCNLLSSYAVNGQLNPARPIALIGMFVLCITIAFFWYLFPSYIKYDKNNRLVIQLSGSLSMSVAMFVFTDFHDKIINMAGVLGFITILISLIGLYKIKWFGLMLLGSLNLLLLLMNGYVYQVKTLIYYLPMLQKISFGTYLIWICILDLKFYYTSSIKSPLV